ncbi:hypothetical protein [Sphingobium sp. YC-XJ3]|uniref:hypothetical protein n=1 Tax=Sphingobium sp. YC-XJ3 TaxID=3024245 RepID=UPI00235FDFEB|nr:hypothetical protein [Sphingobium sp. YC-XJ3]WDA36449.1 hypothetical protein PO876_23970 [Sphingobium sp. YC-XJ3]
MTTDKAPVTVEQAIAFLENACRNWSRVPRLSKDDIADVAMALSRFRLQSTAALEEQITGLIHDIERYIKAGSEEAARAAALEEEIKRLREALTPSGSTKAAYHGEFAFNLHRIDDCGDEYVEKVYVPWDTVKQIMKAILARTALEGRGS